MFFIFLGLLFCGQDHGNLYHVAGVEWEKAPWVMVGIQWCHPPYCLGVKCMCMCMVLSTELAKEMLSNNASHASV